MASRYVPITIGKYDRRLYFDHNAIADLEQAAGMGIGQLFQREMGFHAARLLLWAGLRHEMRGLTVDVAGQMISTYTRPLDERGNGKTFDDLQEALMTAVARSGLFKDLGSKKIEVAEFDPPPPDHVNDEDGEGSDEPGEFGASE